MRLTARAEALSAMSIENSWSRKTVRPSFSDSWNQSRQVMRLPVQLWKYSWPTTLSMLVKSSSTAVAGLARTYLVLKMFKPLVLHRAHVEVLDRAIDHEAFEVQRQAEARFVPDHRGHQRLHCVFGLAEVARAHVDLQQVVPAGARV